MTSTMKVIRLTSIKQKNSLEEAIKTKGTGSFSFETNKQELVTLNYDYNFNSKFDNCFYQLYQTNPQEILVESFRKESFLRQVTKVIKKLGFQEPKEIRIEKDDVIFSQVSQSLDEFEKCDDKLEDAIGWNIGDLPVYLCDHHKSNKDFFASREILGPLYLDYMFTFPEGHTFHEIVEKILLESKGQLPKWENKEIEEFIDLKSNLKFDPKFVLEFGTIRRDLVEAFTTMLEDPFSEYSDTKLNKVLDKYCELRGLTSKEITLLQLFTGLEETDIEKQLESLYEKVSNFKNRKTNYSF